MSAAVQLPSLWGAGGLRSARRPVAARQQTDPPTAVSAGIGPEVSRVDLEYLRSHTEKLLRRYLYASMQIGRAHRCWAIRYGADGRRAAPSGPSRTRSSSC